MREILRSIDRIADSDSSILLVGETGVGKEIFADYIHRMSQRALKPMVKIGLSAMPNDLMASELFGHEKGAYTGADTIKKGLFEIAHQGSLFLDDIDDVPPGIQAKLLRVLESREMIRIGGVRTISVDIRLISASKVDLNEMVKRNLFRSDLFYRLNVVTLEIPPLRDHIDDLPLLAEHFLQKYASNRKITISPETMNCMMSYSWPGNVRELRNVIQRASLFASDVITPGDLPDEIRLNNPEEALMNSCKICFTEKGMEFQGIIECLEGRLIKEALEKTGGNQSNAAKLLGLNLSTFRDKMNKYLKLNKICSAVN